MSDKGKRLEMAMTELMLASKEVYGNDIVISVAFDIILRSSSRDDVTDMGIDDILGDEPNGNF